MYEIINIQVFDCTCEKCGHNWQSRKPTLPTHCANRDCSNPSKWNEPGASKRYKPPTAKPKDLRASKPSDDPSIDLDVDFGA